MIIDINSGLDEASLIGGLLLFPGQLDAVSATLKPDDFSSATCAAVFREMQAAAAEGQPVDLPFMVGRLRSNKAVADAGGAAMLTSWCSIPRVSDDLRDYARLVKTGSMKQQIKKTLFAGYENVDGGQPLDVAADVTGKLAAITAGSTSGTVTSREAVLDMLKDRPAVYSTGYSGFDSLLGGGFSAGQMIVVAAPTSCGKSALLYNLALNLRRPDGQQARVLFVSLEVPTSRIMPRLIAAHGQLPMDLATRLCRGEEVPCAESLRTRFDEAMQSVGKMPIIFAADGSLTPSKLAALVARHRKEIDLVVIDYLQLLGSDNPKSSTYDRVSAASRACQQIAMNFGLPVVAAAQLNREGGRGDEEPQLWHLRESGQIEQDAAVVMMLHRPKRPGVAEEVLTTFFRKNRDGRLGAVQLTFDLENQRIF